MDLVSRLNTAFSRPLRADHDMRAGEAIERRYAEAIAAWGVEHRCVRQDWRGDQWARFRLWQGTGWCVEDAIPAWAARTHREWGRYLFENGHVGAGDTDAHADALRAEIAQVDALAAEAHGGF